MKIQTQWDASQLSSSPTLKRCLAEQPKELAEYHPPNLSHLAAVLEQRRQYVNKKIHRPTLVEALRQSHLRRQAPSAALAAIEQLREPETYLIITGQQPGLLGGPLFTFYKILQAVILAEQYTRTGMGVFLPAFWNAAEDHDFSEIAVLWWLGKDNTPVSFTWPGEPESRRPYFLIPAQECPIDDVLSFIQQNSHSTEFMSYYLDTIRTLWQNAKTYPDLLDALLWSLFEKEGLIILRPEDGYVREQAKPILEMELTDPTRSANAVNQAGQELQRFGLGAQIHKRWDRTSFFLIENKQRIPLYVTANGFQDHEGTFYTYDQIRRRLHSEPETFSPSAILRPIIQDAIFPTIAAILGPNELAYHYLLSPIYQQHGIPRPCLTPRMELTLIEPRVMKLLEKFDLSPLEVKEDINTVIKKLLRKHEKSDVHQLRLELENSVSSFYELLKIQAQEIDATLIPVMEKNRGKILKEIENSESLLLRREAEKNEVLRNQILSLQSALFPDGEHQERRLNIFNYLIKYGPDFLREIKRIGEAALINPHTFLQTS